MSRPPRARDPGRIPTAKPVLPTLLEALFHEALTAVDPEALVQRALDAGAPLSLESESGYWLVAAGKGAAPMARALEQRLATRLVEGLAVTKDGHGLALSRTALHEAGHPIADPRSEQAGRRALELAARVPETDTLIVGLSGGASSLLSCPLPGLDAGEVARTVESLMHAGADIEQLNTVRKHLLAVTGGRLASRCRARHIVLLAISDVPDDRLDILGSGPCTPDPTTFADAIATLEVLGVPTPGAVRRFLEAGARGEQEESVKPGDARLARVRASILANNGTALDALGAAARRRGVRIVVAHRGLRGEARIVGRRLGALARAVRGPVLLVAGGETTVRVRGSGRGGRNQELALAASLELDGCEGVALLAAGTDGSDGPTDAAGAWVDGGTRARGAARGCDAAAALAENDSYGFFLEEGGVFHTGPTRTNVMDLVLLLVAEVPIPRSAESV